MHNYPHEVAVPLFGRASRAYLLVGDSINFMQTHLDNGELIFTNIDGSSMRLALRNPETWWPIKQDYFIDDYQFPLEGSLPPRVNLRTGNGRLLDPNTFKGQGREFPGGAASVLEVALKRGKELKSLTVHAPANDVVIGLMSATLKRFELRRTCNDPAFPFPIVLHACLQPTPSTNHSTWHPPVPAVQTRSLDPAEGIRRHCRVEGLRRATRFPLFCTPFQPRAIAR